MLEQMINNVTNYFLGCMRENDFETFNEMKECYWWTSKDIKEEVHSVLNDGDWSIDEIDGTDILDDNGNVITTYRSFMNKVYANIL